MRDDMEAGYRIREIDVGFSPHYAIEVGDLLGDGCQQVVWANSAGTRLVALEHDGNRLWEAEVANADRHGVTALLIADVDGDGASEVVVGEHPGEANNVLILDPEGQVKRRVELPPGKRDYANCAIDSFGLADIDGDGFRELVVAVNGGCVYVLDRDGVEMLRISGLPDFFEKLLNKERDKLGAAIPSFLSSHPETVERIDAIRTEIDRRGPGDWSPLDIDWEAAKAACDPIPSSDTEKTAREFAEPAGGGPAGPAPAAVSEPGM